MIDLKKVLQNNPNCLATRASFRSVLSDVYPNEKRLINILTIMYESGIVNAIKKHTSIGSAEFNRLLTQLENEYGISPQYSAEAVHIWSQAFSIPTSNTTSVAAPTIPSPIVHAPIVETVIVEGSTSDFETSIENGSITISRFIGFDEKEIHIPNRINGKSVTAIGPWAFAKCPGIERIVIPEGITTIYDGAFYDCKSLKQVSLPSTLVSLGKEPPNKDNDFYRQNRYSHGVFYRCPLEHIALPAGLRQIGPHAFAFCSGLKSIDIPNNVQIIDTDTFQFCSSLESVILPDNLLRIASGAFYYTPIASISFPAKVQSVEEKAFASCYKLVSVRLNEGLKEIGNKAFESCKALREITIPSTVTKIGYSVFHITETHYPSDRRRKSYETTSKNNSLTIACYAGSYALEYARKEGYPVRNAAK